MLLIACLLGMTLIMSIPFLSSKPKPRSDFLIVTGTSSYDDDAVDADDEPFEVE